MSIHWYVMVTVHVYETRFVNVNRVTPVYIASMKEEFRVLERNRVIQMFVMDMACVLDKIHVDVFRDGMVPTAIANFK